MSAPIVQVRMTTTSRASLIPHCQQLMAWIAAAAVCAPASAAVVAAAAVAAAAVVLMAVALTMMSVTTAAAVAAVVAKATATATVMTAVATGGVKKQQSNSDGSVEGGRWTRARQQVTTNNKIAWLMMRAATKRVARAMATVMRVAGEHR